MISSSFLYISVNTWLDQSTWGSSRSPPSASVQVQVEPVGRWFEAFVKRRNRNTSASFQELEEEEVSSEESEDEEFQLEEYPMLRTLDPKDWKVLV